MTKTLEIIDISDIGLDELAGMENGNVNDTALAMLNEPEAFEGDEPMHEYPDAFEHPVELSELSSNDSNVATDSYLRRLREAQEAYCQAGIEVEHAKLAVKQAKDAQKSALEWLEHVMADGPGEINGDESDESLSPNTNIAPTQYDSPLISDWRDTSTSELHLETIKGMGAKKLDAILHEYPTIGKLEELRAEGNGKFMGLQTIKGVGEAMACEIENKILEWLSANRDRAVLATAAEGSKDTLH